MAGITLKNVKKIYPGGVLAVKDFSLEIPDREFVVLVGPSGCGKSTVLRMIAGLESITEGDLFIGGKRMNDVEPKDRDIAMVFQNYALYPHMSVYENMAFGLKLRHMAKKEMDARVHGAARTLAIEEFLDRKPKCLSGGQRQRVALGRAIVREPQAFLLDEPLSNLDAKMRTHMRTEINKLHQQLGATFVYVTHDQVEAMTMGTLIVVMKDGVIQQADNAYRLYRQPKNKFVAGFIGTPQMNFIDVTVSQAGGRMDACFGPHRVVLPQRLSTVVEDGAYILGIRAEDVKTEEADVEARPEHAFEGCVRVIEQLGNEVLLYIEVDGAEEMLIARASARRLWVRDSHIRLAFDAEGIHLFDRTTEESVGLEQP